MRHQPKPRGAARARKSVAAYGFQAVALLSILVLVLLLAASFCSESSCFKSFKQSEAHTIELMATVISSQQPEDGLRDNNLGASTFPNGDRQLDTTQCIPTDWPRRRVVPHVFIIGHSKCGTSTFHELLITHPRIRAARYKELYFFNDRIDDTRYPSTLQEYATWFPVRKKAPGVEFGLDSTSQTIMSMSARDEIRRLFPCAKLIALLCEPVTRFWSHFQLKLRASLSTQTL
jgi:hypothetical protein